MTTLAITGIGGFIGLRMVERAIERGWDVRGFDIDAGGVERAEEAGAEAVVGDVGDPEAVRDVFEGADIVFHTAAIVDETGPHDLFRRVNVEGTENVCRVARDVGVERLVHLSSVMVYGFDYDDGVEETVEFPEVDNIYCATKQESELVARGFHDTGGLEVIAIRPGDVYGAGSRPWVLRPLQMMEAGLFNLPAGGEGVINHVHVDNLLDAIFLALDKGATGEVFNVTDGEATAAKEFFRHHARWLGKEGVSTLPTPLIKGFATVAAPLWRLFGSEPPATVEAIDFLLRRSRISNDKACQDLGFSPELGLEEGMERVGKQLRAQGRFDK